MTIKKGLSKAFTREVISKDSLAPSEFKVVPIKLFRSYADSPIDEIRKDKQMESSFAEARVAEERLRKARVPTESILDREKINRVVQRLNTLKQMQAEKARQEAAKPQATPLISPSAPVENAPKKENSPPASKGSFIQKLNVFKKAQAEKPKEQEAAKPQDTNNTLQSNSTEKAQISPKKETPVKKQEETKNKKDNSIKEPSF
ncbi:hypothetical protein A3K73_00975 [Candidatus Pacearchaeota archaeon RBG_13_36_9]|nr:MAG: hypothetical protein A3K73_00975 [Candidatus Pacearchaeota archaeon RBG_13_36_9]